MARQLSLSWDQVAGIQDRAVRRGLARRKRQRPRRIGVDETSFRKRAEYITAVNDLDRNRVLWISDERKKQALSAFYAEPGPRGCARLESIAMDMWAPYISSTREHVPDADRRIVFDKFHIAQHLGRAVDEVRRAENRELVREGDDRLKKTKYLWLTTPDRMSSQRWDGFAALPDSPLRVARAWATKESAMVLWGYVRCGWAERAWRGWYAWAICSRLEPKGVLRITTIQNLKALGEQAAAYLWITCDRSRLDELSRYVAAEPGVGFVASMLGWADLLAIVFREPPGELVRFVDEVVRRLPGVVDVRTEPIRECVKSDVRWGLVRGDEARRR